MWGDYGRIEGKKVFMGVAQIMLDDLNLSNIVIGWYKLFGTTSLVRIILLSSHHTFSAVYIKIKAHPSFILQRRRQLFGFFYIFNIGGCFSGTLPIEKPPVTW